MFVHGFLRDPGVALAAFGLFGRTFASLRTLEQLLNPLVVVASYYLALLCVGGPWGLLYSLLALLGFFPLFYDWRIVPALSTLICLGLFLRRGFRLWVVAASILTFATLATSFDVGLVTLSASMALIAVRCLGGWTKNRFLLLLYGVPLLCCILAVMLYFAWVNALAALLSWHWQILQVYRDWNGMPYPFALDGIIQMRDAFLSPLASILGIIAVWQGLKRKGWAGIHQFALLLLVSNLTLFNRGVVSGAVESGALATGSHFAPLLLLVLALYYIN